MRPLSGYGVLEEIPYRRWLVPGRGSVLVLERSGDAEKSNLGGL